MKDLKKLRANVANARSAMDAAKGDAVKFEEAKRNYDIVLREYQEDIAERSAMTIEASACSRSAIVNEAAKAIVRNAKNDGSQKTVLMRSAAGGTITSAADIAAAGFPVTMGDLVKPTHIPTIYDKVGVKIQTGVRGNIVWPVLLSAGEIKVNGTEIEATDSAAVEFDKITAAPQRLSIVYKESYESINDASFDLTGTLVEQMHNKLSFAINKALISETGLEKLKGAFAIASDKRATVNFAAQYPTFKELLSMKGEIAKTGADMNTFAYVVNPVTYSVLEATPITNGDSRMIINNGTIAGYPVFQSNDVADGEVKAGCFGYVAMNQHGEPNFIIDPYTLAESNTIRFVLSADWSITVLKEDAFCVGKKKA